MSAVLKAWKDNGWVKPQLVGNTVLNQVSLLRSFKKQEEKVGEKIGDKFSKTENNIAKIRDFLMRHGEMKTRDIAEHIGLGVFIIWELLSMMSEVETENGDKDRRYGLK